MWSEAGWPPNSPGRDRAADGGRGRWRGGWPRVDPPERGLNFSWEGTRRLGPRKAEAVARLPWEVICVRVPAVTGSPTDVVSAGSRDTLPQFWRLEVEIGLCRVPSL